MRSDFQNKVTFLFPRAPEFVYFFTSARRNFETEDETGILVE
jgi:hypothetical protein